MKMNLLFVASSHNANSQLVDATKVRSKNRQMIYFDCKLFKQTMLVAFTSIARYSDWILFSQYWLEASFTQILNGTPVKTTKSLITQHDFRLLTTIPQVLTSEQFNQLLFPHTHTRKHASITWNRNDFVVAKIIFITVK